MSRFLKLREVESKIGFCKATVYNWIKDKTIAFPKPRKIGSSSRWLESDIESWIMQQPTAS